MSAETVQAFSGSHFFMYNLAVQKSRQILAIRSFLMSIKMRTEKKSDKGSS